MQYVNLKPIVMAKTQVCVAGLNLDCVKLSIRKSNEIATSAVYTGPACPLENQNQPVRSLNQ